MCLGVSRIFYFKFAICTLYIFVYVLSDSMPFVSVLSVCSLCTAYVLTLTVPDFAVCQCAVWLYTVWLLVIYVLCADRMLTMCYSSVLCLCTVCLCLCAVCVRALSMYCLYAWCPFALCVLFAVYVCCPSVYVGCLFVSVYADVLALMWLPIHIAFIPIMKRMEILIFFTYIKINLNHHTHLITYIVRIWKCKSFVK